MSAMTLERARPARARLSAVVIGADAGARRRVARLLERGGYAVSEQGIGGAPRIAGALIVVAGNAGSAERIRQARALAQADPGASIIAVMPSEASNAVLRRALVAGAAGIVLDDDLERALVISAHAIGAGQLAVPSALARQIAPQPLSHREKQILRLVVLGLTNREIGHRLFLAESTVKTHLSSAFRKIDARSRSEAVARIQDPDAGLGSVLAAAERVRQ